MDHRPRVLVTRPEPGATETAERLVALGYEPVKLPLQETRPLAVDRDAAMDAVAVAVSSAGAVRHAPPELLAPLTHLLCFAVGEATAKAALESGFRNVTVSGGDADALADAVIACRPAGVVAYLCGKVRRPVFEEKLADAGIRVTAIETYDTIDLDPDMRAGSVDAVLVYSANAAALLAGRMEGLKTATFVCISPRVAEALGGRGGKILAAGEPNETALLKLLGEAVKPAS